MKKSRLRPVSKKQARINAAMSKLKKDMPEVCEYCDSARAVHPHHIYARSDEPSLETRKENLIALCLECHNLAHRNLREFRESLRQKFPERMETLDMIKDTE